MTTVLMGFFIWISPIVSLCPFFKVQKEAHIPTSIILNSFSSNAYSKLTHQEKTELSAYSFYMMQTAGSSSSSLELLCDYRLDT
jgi:hypothetical protein